MASARAVSWRPAAGDRLSRAAPLFAALGDTTRLQLVAALCGAGPQAIVQLTKGVRVSRQAVTKHLRALERVGLVQSGRIGRERVWEMKTRRLSEAHGYLDQISAQWDHALSRLRALVES